MDAVFRVDSALGGFLKRGIDVGGAVVGLILLAPIALAIALLIKADSPGPVFFRQVRVGRRGSPFRIWKFRTMRDSMSGPGVTASGDARVTRVGRHLRHLKLDELPQLLNVLVGEMSLVGPRPELPEFVNVYSDRERAVLELRPGITDPASLHFRNEEELLGAVPDPIQYYRAELVPRKAEINLAYRDRATVFSDVGIVLQTFMTILRPSVNGRG